MRKLRWFVPALTLAALAAEARGQAVLLGGPFGYGGFSYARRGLRVGGVLGVRPYAFAPYPGPWYRPGFGRVTVYSVAPPPPPVVVINSPTVVLDASPPAMPRATDTPPAPPKKEEPKKEAPRRPPPREDETDDPLEKLPRPPAAEADPREEHARQEREGREAFRLGEYGRAALRFRAAARLLPAEPVPYFLLAQALLAQGKYHEAHDAVLAGLARRPDWPASGFRPLELYGEGVVEYTEHLRALGEAVARHPLDPVLLFLYGYGLWFDGRRDEASGYFRRALPRSADAGAINLFLLALPAGETL